MLRSMVRHGDPTTTGGRVFAFASSMFDDGKRVALHAEEATCGNCKGTFKMFGSGTDWIENGRATVLHGDRVLCPCGKNRVIAGGDAGCHIESGSVSAIARTSETAPVSAYPIAATYDDRFILRNGDALALAHTAYVIRRENGKFEYGKTDEYGHTHLLERTSFVEHIRIYIEQ
jgi:uncharacterized Zn-binding protein involved in type VI secretion